MTSRWKNVDRIIFGPPAPLKILIASLTGPTSSPAFYEKAFRHSHRVLTFGPFRDRAFWQDQAASLKLHAFYREGSAEQWGDLCSRLAKPCDLVTPKGAIDMRALRPQLPGGFEPDLFVWIDQHGWNIPLNHDCLGCPSVAIFGDTHLRDNWDLWLKYALTYDFVFVSFNRHHIPRFQQAGCKRVFWSPAAFDPEVHCRIPSDKIYPVSFVGGTYLAIHGERVALIQFLRQSGLDVHVDARLLQEMSLIFSRSKIVLNRSVADDLNMRVFEAMASGSLLFTNRLGQESGQETLFGDRTHFVIYEQQNVVGLIRHYLENDAERERIAERGYAEVSSKHTYLHRVNEIVRVVQDTLRTEVSGPGHS